MVPGAECFLLQSHSFTAHCWFSGLRWRLDSEPNQAEMLEVMMKPLSGAADEPGVSRRRDTADLWKDGSTVWLEGESVIS